MTERDGRQARRTSETEAAPARSSSFRTVLAALAVLAFAAFLALGSWQMQRLQWKLALIERVAQRVNAAPVPSPGPDRWPGITAESDEYRHVQLTGHFLHRMTTRVQASTVRGSGYWLLTPLRTAAGWTVLVNRGFIPIDGTGRAAPAAEAPADDAPITLTGLLRLSETGGGFLRDNDPAAGRWYSRDVQAIGAAHGLSGVAPYFVDADAGQEAAAPGAPVGGLTVVSFRNNHLVYALTWYALALMVAGAGLWVWRLERRQRNGGRTGRMNRDTDDGGND